MITVREQATETEFSHAQSNHIFFSRQKETRWIFEILSVIYRYVKTKKEHAGGLEFGMRS